MFNYCSFLISQMRSWFQMLTVGWMRLYCSSITLGRMVAAQSMNWSCSSPHFVSYFQTKSVLLFFLNSPITIRLTTVQQINAEINSSRANLRNNKNVQKLDNKLDA